MFEVSIYSTLKCGGEGNTEQEDFDTLFEALDFIKNHPSTNDGDCGMWCSYEFDIWKGPECLLDHSRLFKLGLVEF